MRIAVFSDIHSNHTALEACFRTAEARGADLWVFLGDYVSDCANPRATMELLYRARREHDCVFIKGNREAYILGHHKNGSDRVAALHVPEPDRGGPRLPRRAAERARHQPEREE